MYIYIYICIERERELLDAFLRQRQLQQLVRVDDAGHLLKGNYHSLITYLTYDTHSLGLS